VKSLDIEGRVEILSRIAGGEINENTKAFARELLGKALR
jgi:DNA repair ATPase RecN